MTTAHAILWSEPWLPLEVLRAFRMMQMLPSPWRTELLRLRAELLIKLRCWTPWASKPAILMRTAELLRLLMSLVTLFRPTSHHLWPTMLHITMLHITMLVAMLRNMEFLTAALRKFLLAAATLIALWALLLAEMVRTSCIAIIATTIRFMRRIHRSAIFIVLRLLGLTFTAIRLCLRHASAFRPSGIFTIAVTWCIHRTTFAVVWRLTEIVRPSTIVTTSIAILRRIHLTPLATTLRIRWTTIPFTLAFHLGATRQGGRRVRFGYFRSRFVCWLRFLSLQRRKAEGCDTTQPDE